MNWEAVGAIAGLIGVGLVIVSLLYVGIQVRQSNKDARSQSRQALIDTFATLGWEMSLHPEMLEIVAAGIVNWSSLSNMDKTRFDNIMGRYLSNLHRGILQYEDGFLDSKTLDIFGNQMLFCVLMPGGEEWYKETSLAAPEVRRYIADRMDHPEGLPPPASEAVPHWMALAAERQVK